ncbi:hypothetical protein [Hyphomicrobium methylovorum]|uniref:hypothetical protein n=1 Tax=Hyphomicrobium methylovorum TaxID=84 RepID=UPI001FE61C24|nr:hypothetical protein [Hyphomicrobium methylovorum]
MSHRSPSNQWSALGILAFAWVTAAAAALIGFPNSAHAAAEITWRVENPFRFFTDPRDTEAHRATFMGLNQSARATPVLSGERALQSHDADGWASSIYQKTCWNNNQFKCKAYEDYINPSRHAVIVKVEGVDDANMLSCTWLTAPRDGDHPRGKAVTQPCSESVRFEVPYPGGSAVTLEIGGREVAKTDVKVKDILVAGMGDSFASGEGNPDVAVRFSRERSADYSTVGIYSGLTGYPARVGPWRDFGDKAFIKENARWLDQACHRSLYSEQLRAALQLAVEEPHRAVTFVGVSCAGAEITDGLFLRYKGNEWVPNPPRMSQISAVAEAQCGNEKAELLDVPEAYHINGQIPELKGGLVLRKCPHNVARKIDLLLLSIGGNDIGFSRLVANAVLSNESLLRQLGGWLGEVYGEAEAAAELKRLNARYKSLNRALHNILYMPWQESDRILLVAYPGMALEGDGSETCKTGNSGMEVVPDFQLDETKLRLGTWFADKLHREMRQSAEEFGWTFVETHRRKFIGRGLCAGLSVEGVGQADDLRLPRKIDGKWVPYNPGDYQAYATRQRWFRTPNDAFMTGNFHVAAGLMTKVLKIEPFAPFQVVLASTYSGAFHPTAEGQAAIADSVVDKARAVLAKYAREEEGDIPAVSISVPDDGPAPAVDEPGMAVPDVKAILTAPGLAKETTVTPLPSNGAVTEPAKPNEQPSGWQASPRSAAPPAAAGLEPSPDATAPPQQHPAMNAPGAPAAVSPAPIPGAQHPAVPAGQGFGATTLEPADDGSEPRTEAVVGSPSSVDSGPLPDAAPVQGQGTPLPPIPSAPSFSEPSAQGEPLPPIPSEASSGEFQTQTQPSAQPSQQGVPPAAPAPQSDDLEIKPFAPASQ